MIGRHYVTVDAQPEPVDISCLVDRVSIHHGRDDSTSQPEASTATVELTWRNSDDQLPAEVEIGTSLYVDTDLSGTKYRRFAGRITDVHIAWEDAGEDTPERPGGQIIAAGYLADLGRRVVGDEPFPQELDGARVSRVLALADVTLDPAFSDPGTVQILARDIDAQPALEVAQAAALSAGGMVWSSRNGDVRYADNLHRRANAVALRLDACDLLVSPAWIRNTDGLVNSVSITFGVAPEGGGEQPRYAAEDAGSIDRYGMYAASLTTELAALADAQAMGSLLLVRNITPVWVLDGLPIAVADLDAPTTATLLQLDVHSLLAVTGLPLGGSAPTAASMWVEGWTENLADGVHELTLAVSGFCRTTPPPRWDDVPPEWTWDTLPAAMTWDSATCIGPQPSLGRWDDVSASLRWDQIPNTVTWDTWPY